MKNLLTRIFLIISLFCILPGQVLAYTNVTLYQITNDSTQQSNPLIYRNIATYGHNTDIWGYNFTTHVAFPILEKVGLQSLTGFSNGLVVYEETNETDLTTDVWMYNIKTGEDTLVAGGDGSQTSGVTNGSDVLYINGGACGQLYSYNILTQVTSLIVEFTCHPVRVSQKTVVFTQVPEDGMTDVYGYNLGTGEFFPIATGEGFQEVPNIHEQYVVWLHRFGGGYGDYNAIKGKNLATGEEKIIYESSADSINWPSVSGRYVVWSQSPAMHINKIMGSRVSTGEVFEVQEEGPHQNSHTMSAMWGNRAVWPSFRTGNGDIYGSEFHEVK